MKALVMAWFEQVGQLVGDDHVEALDGVGGELARDADTARLGRARAPARLHAAHGDAGNGNAHRDFVCVHDVS